MLQLFEAKRCWEISAENPLYTHKQRAKKSQSCVEGGALCIWRVAVALQDLHAPAQLLLLLGRKLDGGRRHVLLENAREQSRGGAGGLGHACCLPREALKQILCREWGTRRRPAHEPTRGTVALRCSLWSLSNSRVRWNKRGGPRVTHSALPAICASGSAHPALLAEKFSAVKRGFKLLLSVTGSAAGSMAPASSPRHSGEYATIPTPSSRAQGTTEAGVRNGRGGGQGGATCFLDVPCANVPLYLNGSDGGDGVEAAQLRRSDFAQADVFDEPFALRHRVSKTGRKLEPRT